MNNKSCMMDVNDVAEVLSVSKGLAYQKIREMNAELKAQGYITVHGKVPRAYWATKFFGMK